VAVEAVIEAADTDLHAPALCDVEVSAALRRALLKEAIDQRRALAALQDYLDLPISLHGHRSLVHRIVALSQNFSAYDATYVALAEQIGAALLTADQPLKRAVQSHGLVEVASSGLV
jgi:predicted nucleic acid-binding protein